MQTQIGPYNVKARIDFLGPLVYTGVHTDQEGNRRTNFVSPVAVSLPGEIPPEQRSPFVGGLIGHVVDEYILPEIKRRYGLTLTEQEFVLSPEWAKNLPRVLVIKPKDSPATVLFNEEAAGEHDLRNCGYFDVSRQGYKWEIKHNATHLFPHPIPQDLQECVGELARAILSGDDKAASGLARLWFPGTWEDSPNGIRRRLHLEVYVLLFRLQELAEPDSSNDALIDRIRDSFPEAVEDLKSDYSREPLIPGGEVYPGLAGLVPKDRLEEMEALFTQARLSQRELRVVRLEAVVRVLGENWSYEDKAQNLGMKMGNYKAALHRARGKMEDSKLNLPQAHQSLLRAIFGGR